MTSIRSGNTGITGGIKGVKNNKVPTSPKKATETAKKNEGGWKPNHKPAAPPAKPPPAR